MSLATLAARHRRALYGRTRPARIPDYELLLSYQCSCYLGLPPQTRAAIGNMPTSSSQTCDPAGTFPSIFLRYAYFHTQRIAKPKTTRKLLRRHIHLCCAICAAPMSPAAVRCCESGPDASNVGLQLNHQIKCKSNQVQALLTIPAARTFQFPANMVQES